MNNKDLKEALLALGPECGIRMGVPLDKYTSLGIGGPAEVFTLPQSEDALIKVIVAAKASGAPVLALGGGTNLLIPDEGFTDGLVIHVASLDRLEVSSAEGGEVIVRAGAGVRLQRLISLCRKEGYSGLEALSGIPGMLGGAVAGNAGSFDTEIKHSVTEIRLVGFDGETTSIGVEDAGFRYRGSDLPDLGIISGVTLCLKRSTPSDVASKADDFLNRKQAAQPVGERSAGCVFRNPEGYSAGRLIDTAGCKDFKENDIVVSRQHANFFINRGEGTSADFLSLMEKVGNMVYEVHGIRLEPEIRVVGI